MPKYYNKYIKYYTVDIQYTIKKEVLKVNKYQRKSSQK